MCNHKWNIVVLNMLWLHPIISRNVLKLTLNGSKQQCTLKSHCGIPKPAQSSMAVGGDSKGAKKDGRNVAGPGRN